MHPPRPRALGGCGLAGWGMVVGGPYVIRLNVDRSACYLSWHKMNPGRYGILQTQVRTFIIVQDHGLFQGRPSQGFRWERPLDAVLALEGAVTRSDRALS